MNKLPLLDKYDFCLSNYAFTELSLTYRKLYWDWLITRCARGIITDNAYGHAVHGIYTDAHTQYGGNSLLRKLKAMGHRNVQMFHDNRKSAASSANASENWTPGMLVLVWG